MIPANLVEIRSTVVTADSVVVTIEWKLPLRTALNRMLRTESPTLSAADASTLRLPVGMSWDIYSVTDAHNVLPQHINDPARNYFAITCRPTPQGADAMVADLRAVLPKPKREMWE